MGETVKTILEEIDRLQSEAPSDQEERFSKSYLLGRFAGQRETPGDLVADLWRLDYEGLPDDYYQQYLDSVAKVSSPQMIDTAKRLVDEDTLVIVVVGPAKTLKRQLANIAEVVVVDPDAKPAAKASK
ncbi:MAG: hypothetical protein K0V04_26010 [Deltaproteobacteria bacterium]|nr:hypothetical protein [Deltaproteobacteria bacterium]